MLFFVFLKFRVFVIRFLFCFRSIGLRSLGQIDPEAINVQRSHFTCSVNYTIDVD